MDRYLSNPNKCLNCGAIIKPKKYGNRYMYADARKKKFCGSSCSASFNNPNRARKKINKCVECNAEISDRAKRCNKCAQKIRKGRNKDLKNVTKGELFSRNSNYQSARSSIQRDARNTLKNSDRESKCEICGYTLHVDCCHIKSVADFSDDANIGDINNLDNLIWMCKNHHWEFDNGYLKI